MSEGRIRILIADDHALVREGIRRALEQESDLEVVAEACDGEEALRLAAELEPDVMLLDITMPGHSGLEVVERLHVTRPKIRLLVLSMHDQPEYVSRAVRGGAHGYILKEDVGPAELREAVRRVHGGEAYYSPGVAQRLAELLTSESGGEDPVRRLTPRERDVLRGIASGRSNKQIAADLGISRRTVESHRESLMRKLEIRTVAGLTRFALECGLLEDSAPE